jgi:NADPH2:quinone reductase
VPTYSRIRQVLNHSPLPLSFPTTKQPLTHSINLSFIFLSVALRSTSPLRLNHTNRRKMKAICVTESRNLELRNVSSPPNPTSGYITVRIAACSINHGDKAFLKLPPMISGAQLENVWGASAAGTVTQIGPNVPSTYLGRKVAIYRGLKPDNAFLGLWCETAQVPYDACLLLPDHIDVKDYSGSLVNVVTAYAFLEQVAAEGHRGVIVTAGNSATGRALAVLARQRGMAILVIVRSEKSKEDVLKNGVEEEHILNSSHPDFTRNLEQMAKKLGTTAVFDGIGGSLVSKMFGALPPHSSVFFYGFLAGAEKLELSPGLIMMKDLTIKRFSNFDTLTVKERLVDMLTDLEGCIEDPQFRTSLGEHFEPEEFDAAMEYDGGSKKAVVVFAK